MKIITNPHTADVQVIFGPPHQGKKYVIASGKSVSFSDEETALANHFLDTYGFLTVEEKQSELAAPENPLACQFCGYPAKSLAGKKAHERFCKEKKEKVIIEVTPEKTTRVVSRASQEISGFGNTDGLGVGIKTEEVIGNRKQEIVYDRDGVGWYGPGLEVDNTPIKNRPGQF